MIAHIPLNGIDLAADPLGALWWAERRLLAVADLHLEKGAAFARRGALLPPYDTRATLRRMRLLLDRYAPETVVCLGDSFHRADSADGLGGEDLETLGALAEGRRWVWVRGNHDPEPPRRLAGESTPELHLGPVVFRHEAARDAAAGEVSGHFHPKAAVTSRSGSVSARCFVGDRQRLVLPAFGAYAGGLSVRDPAIGSLFPQGFTVWMLGRSRVHRVEAARVVG